MQTRRVTAVLLLIGFAVPSFALTIGRPQGAAWIGKPLDLVIPLQLDASEAGGGLCLEADIVQGDVRVNDRRVTVSLEPGAGPDAPRVHLRTTSVIEEPVVTVTLNAGCMMKSTRRYVLLADVPEVSTPVAAAPSRSFQAPVRTAESSAAASSFGADSNSGSQGGSSADSSGFPKAAPAPVRRRPAPPRTVVRPRSADQAAPAPKPAAKPVPPPVVAQAEKPQPKPRLQVEALEPVPVKPPESKPAPAVAASSAASEPQVVAPSAAVPVAPAPAASAAVSEAALRDAERLQTLEATLASLREQSIQTQKLLLEMKSEVAQARSSRYRNPLVYALLFALLLALIGMVLLWRALTKARAPTWYNGSDGEAVPVGVTAHKLPRQGDLIDEEEDDDVDPQPKSKSRHVEEPDSDFLQLQTMPALRPMPEAAPARAVNTEELFDVQQQSEFFLSLGQHDQAIDVLRDHIEANPGTSALAYLDLFRIFHALDRRDDYAQLRREFERAFNADVPEFDAFSREGRGLEHYQGALSRIEAKWPQPGTLALIEELVFRKPGSREESFDLPAYQELLLLYSVARDVIEPDSGWSTPASFASPAPAAPVTTMPAPAEAEATHSDSVFGAIDRDMHLDTVPMPVMPNAVHPDAPKGRPPLEMDLSDLDQTAFETLRAPIDSGETRPAPIPSSDPHIIDFDPFDPATEDEIAPRTYVIKKG